MVQPWLATGNDSGFAVDAFGPRQMATAAHINIKVGTTVSLNDGTTRHVTAVTQAPMGVDVSVLTVDADLPTWTTIAPWAVTKPTTAMFIGGGYTGVSEVHDDNGLLRGWYWGGSKGTLHWIQTNLRYAGQPMDDYIVAFESCAGSFAMTYGDSGGGFYTQDAAGNWNLQGIGHGIAVVNGDLAVNGVNASQFGPVTRPTTVTYQTSEMLMPRDWLRTFIPLDGDSDFNGTVDFTDLLTLAKDYGNLGSWSGGDFSGDGIVDFSDLLMLAKNYNGPASDLAMVFGPRGLIPTRSAALPGVILAPEPASLTFLAMPLILRRRRRPVN